MATKQINSVLLVGATGVHGFGQHVADTLVKQLDRFSRVAVYQDLTRPTSTEKAQLLERWAAAGIEVVTGHGFLSPEPFAGFDAVLLLLGNAGLHLQPQIIDTAIAAGVRHFYPSEYGADLTVGLNRHMRYYKHKITTREHLLARHRTDVPDLSWTYFLLGRLSEWSLISHFGVDNRAESAQIYGSANGRQSLLATRDAAAYVAATLGIPVTPGSGARTFRVSGGNPTYGEIFATLAAVRGREYRVTYLDVEDARVEEAEAKTRGDVEAELAASHKLVQGLEGTLLPQPWDNARFPEVVLTPLDVAFRDAFASDSYRKFFGLDPL